MAYPEALTANQQIELLAFMPMLRGNLVAFCKLINNFALLNTVYTNGGISAINAALAGADIVPDISNLAGATPLSSTDIITAMTAVQSFLTSYNTPPYNAYFVRAIGPANSGGV